MRRMIEFDCVGVQLAGTLDMAEGPCGLLIVSGGNEIRSGAYAGQAAMAKHFAALGHPVFRYDRRGVGESEGTNGGFETSADDLAAAVAAFREHAPHIQHMSAFGNCDAATALALFHSGITVDALILANPWVIELTSDGDTPTPPDAAVIRARYMARLKNPRSVVDLLTGKIALRKLASGIRRATQRAEASGLAQRLAVALSTSHRPMHILVAARDTTALAFTVVWKSALFDSARKQGHIRLASFDTASHSFADDQAKLWLYAQIAEVLAERE